ncbi:hypothetical protein K443DRAFT_6711 [Laccaria amethystina LaAM-08-1]|uniref:Uncharacterized protein n=1 Tax=Laccaria amethystina LaAM-08-1 TaxID=1095629 RepID=A0A0C9XJJ0_9AGAR|nr:hypothetical protein K443DRAFT_6711 [Laccaria amethystina LaAM-08-1]
MAEVTNTLYVGKDMDKNTISGSPAQNFKSVKPSMTAGSFFPWGFDTLGAQTLLIFIAFS